MVRPLYQPAADATLIRAADGNAGLWYDKFCGCWSINPWKMKADDPEGGKLAWIDTLTRQALGQGQQLEEIANRRIQLSLLQGGRSLVFRTDSRFVTGLGRSHPVENGFAWHHTLGTPYLPGSSIKGMVHAWAKHQLDPKPDKAILARLFGGPGQAGAVCFLDAVPINPVKVEADVITPHYAPWSTDDPPGDWKSPRPIPFLVTASGLRLLFTLLPSGQGNSSDLQQVESWLIDSLKWAGAGAKTAVGYGRMAADRERTEELVNVVLKEMQQRQKEREEAERLASLNPLEQELEVIAQQAAQLPRHRAWIIAVESGRWSNQPAIELSVLKHIEQTMRGNDYWRETHSKKHAKKFNDTQKVRQLLARHNPA